MVKRLVLRQEAMRAVQVREVRSPWRPPALRRRGCTQHLPVQQSRASGFGCGRGACEGEVSRRGGSDRAGEGGGGGGGGVTHQFTKVVHYELAASSL